LGGRTHFTRELWLIKRFTLLATWGGKSTTAESSIPTVTRGIRRVKFILPALTEATSPYWRPIKYSLFPPLGLATLAAYLNPDLEISIQDEHVEKLDLNDEPDLVIIQVYITNAYRAYRIADDYRPRGAYVVVD